MVSACAGTTSQHSTGSGAPAAPTATAIRPTATLPPSGQPFPGTTQVFSDPTSGAEPAEITLGPDGNLWFAEANKAQIGRITPQGAITEWPLPDSLSFVPIAPEGITAGPDGNVWFVEGDVGRIGRLSPAGVLAEFFVLPPEADTSFGGALAEGTDGNLWFTIADKDQIGRISPQGTITLFTLPQHAGASTPTGIAAGPSGTLWFTEAGANRVGRISRQGTITEFPLPRPDADPTHILTGADGNLWFTESNKSAVARITPGGAVTEYAVHGTPLALAFDDLRHCIWFTLSGGTSGIGVILPDRTIREYTLPASAPAPHNITFGPDGALWYTGDNDIVRLSFTT